MANPQCNTRTAVFHALTQRVLLQDLHDGNEGCMPRDGFKDTFQRAESCSNLPCRVFRQPSSFRLSFTIASMEGRGWAGTQGPHGDESPGRKDTGGRVRSYGFGSEAPKSSQSGQFPRLPRCALTNPPLFATPVTDPSTAHSRPLDLTICSLAPAASGVYCILFANLGSKSGSQSGDSFSVHRLRCSVTRPPLSI
jgi:hypothetical protein